MNVATSILNRLLILLGAVGMYVSGVLALSHLSGRAMPCRLAEACDWVASRPESKIFGIPVALFGFLGYAALFGLASVRVMGPASKMQKSVSLGLIISGVGTVFSGYLMYLLLIKWQRTCPWCMTSAAIMTITFVLYGVLSSLDLSTLKIAKFDKVAIVACSILSLAMVNNTVQQSKVSDSEPKQITEPQYTVARLAPREYYFKGAKDAPVTLIEYADFMCPGCRATFEMHKDIIATYKGKLRFAYRSYPLMGHEGHEMSLPAAVLTEIAAEKGLYWEAVEAFFGPNVENSENVETLISVIAPLGLDKKELLRRVKDENDPAVKRVSDGLADATAANVTGTPTYVLFLPGKSGIVIPGESLNDVMTSPEVTAALGVKVEN